MGIKIVKKGRLPENHDKYEGTCRLCKCSVIVDGEDVKSGYPGMDSQFGYYIDCPTEGCTRQIDLEKIRTR